MLIRIAEPGSPRLSEVTPREVYRERRRWLARAAAVTAVAAVDALPGLEAGRAWSAATSPGPGGSALVTVPSPLSVMERQTSRQDVTTYNNFYEFGLDKGDPARHAGRLKTSPWTVTVDGEVAKGRDFSIEELRALAPLEERVCRLRCVEAWSMVIPWVGYSLSALLKIVEPTPRARYVEFTTLADPRQMPGLSSSVMKWPYVEGLRLDEALHPLAMLAVGLYGELLPNQNGAPIRLVVPWKYGFKSAKSLVRIRLTEQQPMTSWHLAAPREYGFYSNVNPAVDHPRWSQATERRIGEDGFFKPKRKTLMFNGYESQVGQLYAGMDLARDY